MICARCGALHVAGSTHPEACEARAKAARTATRERNHGAPTGPILVDLAPLLALRTAIDRVLAGVLAAPEPFAVLEIEIDHLAEKKPWVAEVVTTPHGFLRAFLRGRRDYSHVDKKGRGVREHFVLRPDCVYEVCRPARNQRASERYFCRLRDGEIQRVTPEEMQAWADGLHLAAL